MASSTIETSTDKMETEIGEDIGGVLSSQPEIDGTAMDEEMKGLVKTQADQLDIWYKKLANIERRATAIQSTLDLLKNGQLADIPPECRIKKMELPSLPAGLGYSVSTDMTYKKMQKDNQVNLLNLVLNEYRKFTIPGIEKDLSLLIANTRSELSKCLSLEAVAMYIAMSVEKRKSRVNFLVQPTPDKVKAPEHLPHQKKMNQRPFAESKYNASTSRSTSRSKKPKGVENNNQSHDRRQGNHHKPYYRENKRR
jgi:hypothetical protein